jgi:hypothetical protein
MPNYWTFVSRCLRFTFSHSWGALDYASTACGICVGFIVWKWGPLMDPATQKNMAELGGWVIPLTAFALVTIIRFVMAPYWTWKEERERAQFLQDELSKYDETPVVPTVEVSSNSEPIRVKLVNRGKEEEPVDSVCLYLCDGEHNEPFRLLWPDKEGEALPLTMGRKKKHYVTFDIAGAHCIQWGVRSVFAVVHLEDGRQRESNPYTIRNSSALAGLLVAPAEHSLERTWEQSMVRHKRIHEVANAYRRACALPVRAMAVNRLRDLHEARIRDLEDATEVHELFTILDANKVRHPFDHGEDVDSILGFYKTKPTNRSIGGIVEWIKAYNEWFDASLPIPE